jgi:DinB superfamily
VLPPDWDRLLADHTAALEEYLASAMSLSLEVWIRPMAQGKWTPAELTSHVAEAYRVLRGELGGQAGMNLRGSPLQRFILRHTVLPRLLAGKPFPPGVRAPRETRPKIVVDDRQTALRELGSVAELFTTELGACAGPASPRLTHAYFGLLSPRQALQLVAVHTRHHARQLAGCRLFLTPS